MPVERIVEFRVAAPIDILPEIIFYIGKTRVAMFEDRHPRLVRPRDPEVVQRLRRLDEIISFISQYYQPNIVSLPRLPLISLLDQIENEMMNLFNELRSSVEQLQALKSRLLIASVISQIKGYSLPKTEVLDSYIVIPGKYLNEIISISKNFGASNIYLKDAILITIEKSKSKLLLQALNKLGVPVLSFEDIEKIEDPNELNNKIVELNEKIKNIISKNKEAIDRAYTLKYALTLVIETFNKSAIAEGEELGHLFSSLASEIERLHKEIDELKAIREVIGALKSLGKTSLRIPEELELYAEVADVSQATPIKIGDRVAYFARSGTKGIKVPRQYLEDVPSSLNVIDETLKSAHKSLEGRMRDLETLKRIYEEYSTYGDYRWDLHRDVASIIFYVQEKDVQKIDDVLTDAIKALSIKIDIIRKIRYKYFDKIPAERRPTLEKFPAPVRQIVNKIAYMYGVPSAEEISPSILVAVLFPVFFGWMFGDLGHGALLFLLGLFLYTKLFGGKYKDWGVIWMTTGILSMIFGGIVYGEVFGLPLSSLGVGWDGLVHMFQPVVGPQMGTAIETEGIFLDLLIALLFGYLIMAGSFSLKIVNFIIKGEGDMALGIGLPILLVYVSAGMIVFNLLRAVLPMPDAMLAVVDLPWIYILIISIILLIIGSIYLLLKYKKYEEKPPIGLEMAVGLVEGIFGGLANVPSFARLMILILMHAIFTKMVAGWALAIASSGNLAAAITIAIVFNGLIAVGEGFMSLVQSLRLTFYETLSKFYEGRGRLFTPLALP
ncbi:V-type ATPase 116kDa subunit family protein [Thermoproteus tenax]|uniref:A-type ATP synthase subunit I n=1 Tax=Thermoproteus tenax (strain ATCC 35583 / DSM 2078 / JCM 9277 / NBRC 100435 / Kra 1) TaxID=768679 RepID=G4RKT1_THETK|nr:V-type ATPase 116kDa subunit family protein [Thermoproteus tenax]CCC82176.1 H+-transporting A1A0 ATP synthase, subunit I [Thermoproteus tenax Kra 1]